MKRLFTTLLLLTSLNSFAGLKTTVTKIYSLTADTEQEVLDQASDAIRGIKNASIKKVIIEGRRHQCTFKVRRENSDKFILIKGVEVTKMYDMTNGGLDLRPFYRANIKFKFMKCRSKR